MPPTERVLIGDIQRGYQFAAITYLDAELIGADAAGLRSFELTGRPAEILSDEIDLASESRYEHRSYFWPGHEYGVRFGSVPVDLAPASGDARR